MEKIYNNIYYFRRITTIGGTEQFLYEIAKKYLTYDLTIFYDEADKWQLNRLRKLVRCKMRKRGEKIKCKKAFFNFNIDMIDDVEAEDYYFVIHANYDALGYTPPTHPKINHYIGVSQFATDRFLEDMGIKAEKCYNPLTLEPKEKVLHLVSACRLEDVVKGGERTKKLVEALDKYCEKTGRHYMWTIFSNSNTKTIDSKNVIIAKPRTDVRPYIAEADYVLQLSNDMETYCYTINEALGYGVPIVTTPLTVVKELPIDNNMRIELDWDCKNVDEVAKLIFEKKVKKFEYTPPEDNWSELLEKGKSTYDPEKEKNKYVLVEALPIYEQRGIADSELKKMPLIGEKWVVDEDRYDFLNGNNRYDAVFVKKIKDVNKND